MNQRLQLKVNTEYPKTKISGTTYFDGKPYKVDLRSLLYKKDDYILEKVIRDMGLHRGTDHGKKMQVIWEYMRDNMEYKTDMLGGEKKEHWTLPAIVLQRGYDDCDGMAVLMASLALAAKIPYYRIKVALGTVKKDEYSPTGYHAYVLFLNEEEEWEIWESTAKNKGRKGLLKELLGESRWYRTINNSFNTKFAFNHK